MDQLPAHFTKEIKIAKETQAKRLDIRSKILLPFFPEEIFEIPSLEVLLIGGFKRRYKSPIKEIPPQIKNLKNLRALEMVNCSLESLPPEFAELTQLDWLDLGGNFFTKIPAEVFALRELKMFNFAGNLLTQLPDELFDFPKLERIHLTYNQLTQLPPSIQNLKTLKHIYLGNNQIRELPEEIGQLPDLIQLVLAHNRLRALPSSIKKLKNLQKLYLHHNRIERLPKEITELEKLDFLYLRRNPLKHPPEEIVDQGLDAVRNYFEEIEKGRAKNYEAKLVVVGNGRIGKTSLTKRLISNTFDENEPSTHGIRIEKFHLPLSNNPLQNQEPIHLKINTWDFGGQEIYHATHRFFLSTRALYLLVWDKQSRENAEQNPEKEEYFSFAYWLDYIKTLSQGSPVLMVQNKIDLGKTYIDNPNELIQEYNVKDFVDVSAANNENLEQLKRLIQQQFGESEELKDIIGFDLPASWVQVKEQLEALANSHNYISYKQYLKICLEVGLEKASANNLSHNFLHQIGTILHFPQPKQLKDMVILNPRWATEAVYEVLKAEQLMQSKGYFDEEDLEEIWEAYELSEQISFIELMKKFEILFEMPHQKQHYIAPQLLAIQKPKNLLDIPQPCFQLVYQYKFLHKGIITRLITKMSEFAEPGHYWKYGIQVAYDDTQALIEAHPRQKQICLSIQNASKKTFLQELMQKAFDDLHQELAVEVFIPYTSPQTQTTHHFPLEELERRIEHGVNEIECPLSFDKVSIDFLLTGIENKEAHTNTPLSQIQQWVGMGRLPKALEAFLEITQEQPEVQKKLRLLQGKLADIQDNEDLGLITSPEASKERAKVSRALLNLLDRQAI